MESQVSLSLCCLRRLEPHELVNNSYGAGAQAQSADSSQGQAIH